MEVLPWVPKKRTILSSAEVEVAIEQIRLGQPISHVANELRVHRHTLSRFIARMGRAMPTIRNVAPFKDTAKMCEKVVDQQDESSVIRGDALEEAVQQVKLGRPIVHVAREMCISRSTLSKFLQRRKSGRGADYIVRKPAIKSNRFFNPFEERQLEEYAHTCHLLFHLLTADTVRSLAYQYAVKLDKKTPKCWRASAMGGKDWFSGYLIRHQSIQTSDTALIKSANFQRSCVSTFFDTWSQSVQLMGYGASSVYCLDEVELRSDGGGIYTPTPARVWPMAPCPSSFYQPAVASTNTLFCVCANADGKVLPPLMVYPRSDIASHPSARDYPTLVTASGNVTDFDVFAAVLRHFVSVIGCSRTNPVALIISDRASHVSVAAIDIARDCGVSLLATPPRCSNRLMPLAQGVLDNFCELIKRKNEKRQQGGGAGGDPLPDAFNEAVTSDRVRRGFERVGLWPLNRGVVDDATWFGLSDASKRENSANTDDSGMNDSGIGRSSRDGDTTPGSGVRVRRGSSISPRKRGSLTTTSSSDGSNSEEGSGDELGDILELSCRDPEIGDFVLIRFAAVNSTRQLHYVGQVVDKVTTMTTTGQPSSALEAASSSSSEETFFDVEFYRQCSRAPGRFTKPQVRDTSRIVRSDIVTCLPEPVRHRGATKRVSSLLQFKYDLTQYNCQ